jgi:hypothetical protein
MAKNYCNVSFVLFDFNLEVGKIEKIEYTRRFRENNLDTLVDKNYNLRLLSKFFDSKIQDTVYQFKFENYHIHAESTAIVFFIGKNVGIVGQYISDREADPAHELIIGGFKGNVYKDRFDYSKIRIVRIL